MLLFSVRAEYLKPGDPAPAIELTDQHGKMRHLFDCQGQWLLVYFYREDDTLDCASEAREFCDESVTLQGVDISFDAVKSHSEFPEKYCSPFPLLNRREQSRSPLGVAVYGSRARSGLPGGIRPALSLREHIAKTFRPVAAKTRNDKVTQDLENLRS